MTATYGSVCSGIESASVAWEPLGMSPQWFSEIEPFPSAVLAHHWPQVGNVGDMTAIPAYIRCGMLPAPDILVGGTPCQAFSVAGKRQSLDDERSQLTLSYVEILDAIDDQRGAGRESVCVWENVPGVLGTKDNAFGCFLAGLAGESEPLQPAGTRWPNAGCVFGPQRAVAWRILDAQYFGVAQRRRRVFVVASARDGFDPAAVLFEPRAAGESSGKIGGPPQGTSVVPDEHIVCVKGAAIGRKPSAGPQFGETRTDGLSYTLNCTEVHAVAVESAVRRLTPVECERLQGFPDNHTLIPWRGKPADQCPDGPRYKAIGNSKAVPVVRWIGARILRELSKCK